MSAEEAVERRLIGVAMWMADTWDIDITADDALNQHGSGGGSMSLREVLVSSIWEYGRHMGHVDLLRERIDGRIGQ